jgi:ATP-binding cassette subfamily G (WHITE) protein 2
VVPFLCGVSGQFLPRQLTAIMGPSGSGKTTFLNAISGFRVTNVRGSVLINGLKVKGNNFRKVSVYIMQARTFSGSLMRTKRRYFASFYLELLAR